jgi:hypothetical protein
MLTPEQAAEIDRQGANRQRAADQTDDQNTDEVSPAA